MRRLMLLVVILLHGLLLWLLALGFRARTEVPEPPRFVSLWLPPLPDAQPVIDVAPAVARDRPAPEPVRTQAPATTTPAIATPPVVQPLPVPPVPDAPVAPVPSTAPSPPVDWSREIASAAKRSLEAAAAAEAATARNPMNQKPKVLAKPCKPKERSMEWKGQEDRRVTMAGPLPVVKINKRCALVLIFPMCVLGELPEANGHLLDDMADPERSRSSVPDPNVCD
jgi:hypothetical protein